MLQLSYPCTALPGSCQADAGEEPKNLSPPARVGWLSSARVLIRSCTLTQFTGTGTEGTVGPVVSQPTLTALSEAQEQVPITTALLCWAAAANAKGTFTAITPVRESMAC